MNQLGNHMSLLMKWSGGIDISMKVIDINDEISYSQLHMKILIYHDKDYFLASVKNCLYFT